MINLKNFIPNILLSQLKKNGILLLPLKINNNLFFTIVQKDKKGNILGTNGYSCKAQALMDPTCVPVKPN